ncbi:hypothetical protein KQH61_04830 [bacterium]|nr:hypothetical protein [bacterium]MCB2179226.1 hypothetical protein [bacterium]
MPEWLWFVAFGVPVISGLILWGLGKQEEDRQLRFAIGSGIATGLALALITFWPGSGVLDVTLSKQMDGMILFGFFILIVIDIAVTTVLSSFLWRRVMFKTRWFKHFFWLVGSLAAAGVGQKFWQIALSVALLAFAFMQVFFPTELIMDVRRDRQRRVEEERRR